MGNNSGSPGLGFEGGEVKSVLELCQLTQIPVYTGDVAVFVAVRYKNAGVRQKKSSYCARGSQFFCNFAPQKWNIED
jgi:hypothetical protein